MDKDKFTVIYKFDNYHILKFKDDQYVCVFISYNYINNKSGVDTCIKDHATQSAFSIFLSDKRYSVGDEDILSNTHSVNIRFHTRDSIIQHYKDMHGDANISMASFEPKNIPTKELEKELHIEDWLDIPG